jgi:hypothetical protein
MDVLDAWLTECYLPDRCKFEHPGQPTSGLRNRFGVLQGATEGSSAFQGMFYSLLIFIGITDHLARSEHFTRVTIGRFQ